MAWLWLVYVVWLFLREDKAGPGILVLCIVGAILLIVQVRFELRQICLDEEAKEEQQARQLDAGHKLPVGAPEAWREG